MVVNQKQQILNAGLNDQMPVAGKDKKSSSSVHVQDHGNLDSERVINVKAMGSVT